MPLLSALAALNIKMVKLCNRASEGAHMAVILEPSFWKELLKAKT
jgi:hypothetical protein